MPVEFFDHDEIEGWASNSDVTISLSSVPLPDGMTWEQSLELQANDVSGPITPEHTTIAGQPAVREDNPPAILDRIDNATEGGPMDRPPSCSECGPRPARSVPRAQSRRVSSLSASRFSSASSRCIEMSATLTSSSSLPAAFAPSSIMM